MGSKRPNALQVEQIDQLAAFIAAKHKLRLIPGDRWAADPYNSAIMYPRQAILEMSTHEARGHLWRTIEHFISSRGIVDPYTVAVDASLGVRDALSVNCVHPRWIMPLFFHAERERATELARGHGKNIETRALPRRGLDYRAKELPVALKALERPPDNEESFWKIVAFAFELLLEGSIGPKDLPPTLQWDGKITEAIASLLHAPTYDQLLNQVEALVLPIATQRLRDLEKRNTDEMDVSEDEPANPAGAVPDEPANASQCKDGAAAPDSNEERAHSGDTDENSDSDDSGESSPDAGNEASFDEDAGGDDIGDQNAGDKTEESGSDEAPKPEIDPQTQEQIEAEVGEQDSEPTRPDFVNDNPNAPIAETAKQEFDVENIECEPSNVPNPAWAAVARGAARLTNTIRDTFLAYLEENEIGEMAYGTRTGRLDVPVAGKPAIMQRRRPFKRRSVPYDHSYALGIIVDTSGSMGAGTEGRAYPETFGPGPIRRWHLATRMTVATVEAAFRLPQTDLCIVAYHTPVHLVKALRQLLDAECKYRVMEQMGAYLENSDAEALKVTIDELVKSTAECKMIFHLTDGAFCSEVAEVRKQIARAASVGIQVVILTLDLPPDSAREFVPAHMADEINDENVGKVLAKHLQRMLAAA